MLRKPNHPLAVVGRRPGGSGRPRPWLPTMCPPLRRVPPPPPPMAEDVPVPREPAADQVKLAEPAACPGRRSGGPAGCPAKPAPQAEAVPAERASPGAGTCPKCAGGCRLRRLQRIALRGLHCAPLSRPRSALAWPPASCSISMISATRRPATATSSAPRATSGWQDIARMFPGFEFPIHLDREHAGRCETRRRAAGLRLETVLADERGRAGPACGGRAPPHAFVERTRGRLYPPEPAQADQDPVAAERQRGHWRRWDRGRRRWPVLQPA